MGNLIKVDFSRGQRETETSAHANNSIQNPALRETDPLGARIGELPGDLLSSQKGLLPNTKPPKTRNPLVERTYSALQAPTDRYEGPQNPPPGQSRLTVEQWRTQFSDVNHAARIAFAVRQPV